MATGGLAVIRDNLFYVGAAKQAAWGTAITTPTWYHTWLDGTDIIDGAQHQAEREGDTTPVVSFVYKSGQYWGFKVVEYMRPQSIGYVLEALLGTGSDAYTGPTKSTTLSGAGNTAGSTTVVTVGDLSNVGTLAVNINPGYGNASYEVVTLDLTTRTGVGPYTYTIAASGKLKNTHNAAEVVNSVSQHVFTRQQQSYDPCTYEFGYGLSSSATKGAFRLTDAVCTDATISGQKGRPWRVEHSWIAATGKLLTGVQTLTNANFEGTNQIGNAGSPFMWYQGSQWNINGAGTNNAATIESFQLQLKNTTAWDELQSEALTPAYFHPGNFDVSGQLTVQFQSWQQYYDMYFGSPTAANNSTDSYLVGFEAIDLICAPDAVNSIELNLPRCNYTAGKLTPKLDGKVLTQALSFTASKPIPGGSFSDIAIFTLKNSQSSQY